MADDTETERIARIAQEAMALAEVQPGKVYERVLPHDGVRDVLDLDWLAPHPRRARGTVTVHDADGFATAVRQRCAEVGDVVIYVDELAPALVAVLNDDTIDDAGWRDYTVRLGLRKTPEWVFWNEHQGLGDQEKFAETIEEGLDEITNPDPASMLELAQTFHATTTSRFSGGQRLATGERQLLFSEDITASSGSKAGQLSFPGSFTIKVKPYLGTENVVIEARLRFRLRDGKLQIGYQLHRPEEVERQGFHLLCDTVERELPEAAYIAGSAPAARA